MKIIWPNDKEEEKPLSIIGRIILVLVGLWVAAPIIFGGALFTAFAGTIHSAPNWYFLYLGITQAIPLIVATVSWIAILMTIHTNIYKSGWSVALLCSFLIYGASFVALASGIVLSK
ncbi:hypothetical protein U737_11640 [Methylomonas sp. LW13]|uniref:hypothetical protein n=1 Tax=unclassified Methylomonas TaxID=2608980 RepID=UPI00051ADAD3|nr:hypothetical protein [Methylomonas sp. LW13]QBC27501.1 hypothetical protein U737_11640 [Methylomonas sp. LW13]